MIAFNIEALLLLALAFLAGLGLGLFIARRRQPDAVLPAAAVPPEMPSGGQTAPQRMPQTPAPEAPPGLPAAEPPHTVGSDDYKEASPMRVRPEPEPDLFTRLLASAPPLPPEDEEDEPPPPASTKADSATHPGERPPTLEAPEDGVADDLKLLKGIGPQNERRLNALGIFHFRQIAAWTPEQAAWVGSYLAFPGRIEREDWIGQAQAFISGETPPEGPGRRKR